MVKHLPAPERVVLLLSLVPYLRERAEVGLEELASAFDVPPALMRELVAFLGTAGVPGETGTYQHEDLFDIDWAALDEGVVRLTRTVAVEETPRFSGVERIALIAGLHALTPIVPESDRVHARSAAAKLGVEHADEHISVAPEAQTPALADITAAIDAGRRLSFHYRDLRGAESERTVEPLALTQTGFGAAGGWYLRAYCLDRQADRTFLVDAMRELRVLPDAATQRTPAQLTETEPKRTGAPGIVAQLRVRERSLHRISAFAPNVLGRSHDAAHNTDSAGERWLRVEVELASAAVAIRLIQSAPGDVEVDTPEAARSAVRNWAERALSAY